MLTGNTSTLTDVLPALLEDTIAIRAKELLVSYGQCDRQLIPNLGFKGL
jgi:hypothetical protein